MFLLVTTTHQNVNHAYKNLYYELSLPRSIQYVILRTNCAANLVHFAE